jgi:Cu-processing system permease protein
MKNILTIARNTFKEAIRDRILYAILAFALLFLVSTFFLGSISLGEDIKVVKDLGLAGIYIFSIIIAVFLGTSLVYKELEKKTLYIIISKPVSFIDFAIGKFLGLWAGLSLNIFLMTIAYLIIVKIKGGGIDYISLYSILLLIFEIAIFIALTILFSSFTTPLAGAIYSVIFLYIGHSLSLLKQSAEKSEGFYKYFADGAYYILPNLEKFNLRNSVVYGVIPNSGEIVYPIIYSIIYTSIFIWLAVLALKKQEL